MPIQETQDLDLRQFVLDCTSFGPAEISRISTEMSRRNEKITDLRDGVNELAAKASDLSPSMMVKLGVCQYLIGRYDDALESLTHSDGGALAQFYMAKIHAIHGDNAKAMMLYDIAKKAGYDPDRCVLGQANVYLDMGEPKKALALLDRLSGAIEQTADYLALRGATVAATCENPDEAVNLYERAYKADSNHPETLFGLALESERRGNDDDALKLYRQASHCFPTSVGTLMNLGVLLEDKERYEEAADCYNRVIEAFPNNKRARLFLKDAQDHLRVDTRSKPNPPGSRHLNTPINEIEFSSRVRRVIEELGCKTLGDLARQRQEDLLQFENFGENSLKEIELKLDERELHLGWTDDELLTVPEYKPARGGFAAAAAEPAGGEDQAVLTRPVSDLELSRRAANCLKKRNVKTIGDLIKQSADDLMETANFGVTSLKEIREKLASKFALKLKGDETQGK